MHFYILCRYRSGNILPFIEAYAGERVGGHLNSSTIKQTIAIPNIAIIRLALSYVQTSSLARSLFRSFVRMSFAVRSFVSSSVLSFVYSFVRPFVPSFLRQFARRAIQHAHYCLILGRIPFAAIPLTINA